MLSDPILRSDQIGGSVIRSSGYVIRMLEAATGSVEQTDRFEEARCLRLIWACEHGGCRDRTTGLGSRGRERHPGRVACKPGLARADDCRRRRAANLLCQTRGDPIFRSDNDGQAALNRHGNPDGAPHPRRRARRLKDGQA